VVSAKVVSAFESWQDCFARRHLRRSGIWHADAQQICMGICILVLDFVIVVTDCINTLLPL
jgi:hypothetical protein